MMLPPYIEILDTVRGHIAYIAMVSLLTTILSTLATRSRPGRVFVYMFCVATTYIHDAKATAFLWILYLCLL